MSTGLLRLQCGGSSLVELLQRRGRKFGEFAARADDRVGSEHARTSGIGHNCQARTLGTRLFAERLGHVKQVGDRVDAQHAAAAECGLQHFVAAGQRSGVRRGGVGGSGACVRP